MAFHGNLRDCTIGVYRAGDGPHGCAGCGVCNYGLSLPANAEFVLTACKEVLNGEPLCFFCMNAALVGGGLYNDGSDRPKRGLRTEPTLLEACQAVAADLEQLLAGDDFSGMSDDELFAGFLRVLRPAIDKAEGRGGSE